METYAFALALTIAIELPILLVFAPRALRQRTLLDVPLVNLVTHALGWLAVQDGGLPWLPVELSVALVEFVVYARITKLPIGRAAAAAATANTISATLGLWISAKLRLFW